MKTRKYWSQFGPSALGKSKEVVMNMTSCDLEAILVVAMQSAANHADEVLLKHCQRDEGFTRRQCIGSFCSALRTGLMGTGLITHENHFSLSVLFDVKTWTDILLPMPQSYNLNRGCIQLVDGEWKMDHEKIKKLADMVKSTAASTTAPSQETEIARSFGMIERSLPILESITREASLINAQSDLVICEMIKTAQSLDV